MQDSGAESGCLCQYICFDLCGVDHLFIIELMWGLSTPLNMAWCCIAFASGYFISSMCSPLSTLSILCRSAATQGAYMCAVLNWSLSFFPFSTLFCLQSSSFPSHFSFPGERQDDDTMHPLLLHPAETMILACKGDFTGILHFIYQPSSVKKGKEGSHASSDLTFFLGPLLKLFLPWQYL